MNAKEIGYRIARARQEQVIQPIDVAKKINLDVKKYLLVEKGEKPLSLKKYKKIEQILNIDLELGYVRSEEVNIEQLEDSRIVDADKGIHINLHMQNIGTIINIISVVINVAFYVFILTITENFNHLWIMCPFLITFIVFANWGLNINKTIEKSFYKMGRNKDDITKKPSKRYCISMYVLVYFLMPFLSYIYISFIMIGVI